MPFPVITKPAVGEPTRADTFSDLVIEALNFLNGQSSLASTLAGIVNGSFELGSGANTDPTGWVVTRATGNSTSFGTSAANTRHGSQSFAMTTPGSISGGVSMSSADFIACAEGNNVPISWRQKSTAAGVRNIVQLDFYDVAQVFISTSTLLDSTANPTSWTLQAGGAVAPANARFFKVTVVGVDNAVAGTVYWDDFELNLSMGMNVQTFTATSTYVPAAGVTKVKVRAWAGGAGGGGAGDSGNPGGTGSVGGDTWFGSSGNKARGGNGGGGGGSGAGGATGSLGANLSPVIGSSSVQFGTFNTKNTPATHIGAIATGLVSGSLQVLASGAAGAPSGGDGGNGTANTGAGGGGGTGDTTGGFGGGGAPGGYGEYAEWWIDVLPGASYTVTIGAGGAGGTGTGGGGAGGNGGKGLMIVEAIQQEL